MIKTSSCNHPDPTPEGGMSYDEIGKEMGFTGERARQVYKKSLLKMRKRLGLKGIKACDEELVCAIRAGFISLDRERRVCRKLLLDLRSRYPNARATRLDSLAAEIIANTVLADLGKTKCQTSTSSQDAA